MDKKGKEKFHFVSSEEETKPKEEVKETKDKSSEKINVSKKPYFGFKTRITVLVILVLVFFIIGLILMYKAISYTETKIVQYDESADATYKACITSPDPYLKNCIDSYHGPLMMVTDVKVNYSYLAKTEKNAKMDLTYYVTAISRVYDKFDSSRVLYENEETVVPRRHLDFKDGKVAINEEYYVDVKEILDNIEQYQSKYIYSSNAVLEIVSYIDDGSKRYKTGTINIPLSENEFKLYKNFISSKSHDVEVEVREWTERETIIMIVGIVLMFISLVTLFILTKLVARSLRKKSKYEQKLDDILTTYEDVIVDSTENYEIDKTKKKIKIKKFEDMLDTRKVLNKPIIYNKVNNVKSEFIIEDYEKIYVYVLKEADVEK